MKIIDLEKWIYRINIAVLAGTFFLLAPTTTLIAAWAPEQSPALWLFPLLVLGLTSLIWILFRLSLPWMIRRGVFEDRRRGRRNQDVRTREKLLRYILPAGKLILDVLVLFFVCVCFQHFLRSDAADRLFFNLP